jgi:hypothetical protein
MNLNSASVGALLVQLLAATAYGWGAKGHMMCGRLAAQALPDETPLFFRSAAERLAYLTPEPDRWRGEAWGGHRGPRRELTNLTAGNHNIRMELLEGIRFPLTRNEYIVLMVERGIVPRDEVNMHKVGMIYYAIIEEMQRLTVQFRLWREAQEAAVLDPVAVAQIQENVIFSAGVLGHWITDSAQPLHVTVHSDDWDNRFPNPNNYATRNIHGRFESVYVDRAVSEDDIRARMTPVKLLRDWRADAEAHIRRAFRHVEAVYSLDRQGAFGSGSEVEEAHGFTAARLAEGASMLRDAWYSAWIQSGEELLDAPVRQRGKQGKSALDLLRESKRVETAPSESGTRVVAVGGRRESPGGRRWTLSVNGKAIVEPPEHYMTTDGELLEWRFQ